MLVLSGADRFVVGQREAGEGREDGEDLDEELHVVRLTVSYEL